MGLGAGLGGVGGGGQAGACMTRCRRVGQGLPGAEGGEAGACRMRCVWGGAGHAPRGGGRGARLVAGQDGVG